jgi:hypothetical protein
MTEVTVGWSLGRVRRRRAQRISLLACATLLLGVAGCGSNSNTARLSGTVTLNGQPLPDNMEAPTIMFQALETGKGKGMSAPIVDGKYDAKEVPKGNVKVYFNLSQWTGEMIQEGAGTPFKEMQNLVPAAYASGIDLTVDVNNSAQDFDLKEGSP